MKLEQTTDFLHQNVIKHCPELSFVFFCASVHAAYTASSLRAIPAQADFALLKGQIPESLPWSFLYGKLLGQKEGGK